MTFRNSAWLLPVLAPLSLSLGGCRHSSFPEYPASYREFAYVANTDSNTVTVLDLVYLRQDRTLSVGNKPTAILVSPLRPEVYILNSASGSVSVIDSGLNQVVATIPVRHNPTSLSLDRTGRRLFVANTDSGNLSVIDLDARRTLTTVQTPAHPTSALISPDGRTLVVTLPDTGSIALFSASPAPDPKSPPPVASLEPALTFRASFDACPGAVSPVILPDSSKVFVACPGSNQVLAVALAAAPNSWAARQSSAVLADHSLALLDVGQRPSNLTLKPDGGEIFVSNTLANSISEISTQTNEVGNTFPIGDAPAHGVVSADNSALWISNSGADSISLYSIDDGKLISSIRTGNAPDALAFSDDQHLLLAADRKSGDVALIRTNSKPGPGLFTLLPAGAAPSAIAIKATTLKP